VTVFFNGSGQPSSHESAKVERMRATDKNKPFTLLQQREREPADPTRVDLSLVAGLAMEKTDSSSLA